MIKMAFSWYYEMYPWVIKQTKLLKDVMMKL